MITASVKSYAKLNLTLDIKGAANGFHELDSLVCSVNICDTLFLKKRRDSLVNVYMRGRGSESIPPEQNNAVKAGEAFVRAFNTTGADITIWKDIPLSGGLGGSSADIAGVLRGMAKLYGLTQEKERLKEIADSLGSDAGYMLTGGFARLRGRGEIVQPLPCVDELHFLLIQPPTGVSAKDCFLAFDRENASYPPVTEQAVSALIGERREEFFSLLKNDLQNAACSLSGEVKQAVAEGKDFSPLACSMTGSGSCVFVLFENEEFCRWAKSRYKGKFLTRIVKSVLPNKKRESKSLYSLTEEERNLLNGE